MSDTVSTTDALRAFKMCDRIYFIGNEEVSVHLLDTVQGLVLIDTGYPNMYTIIVENIKNLGFEPKNISAIFHTHGHIDHYGCTRELVALSGAKTYIGRIDNDIVNGTYDLSWAFELGLERIPPFDCDVLLEDGDVFDFGNISVRCVHTPGHTAGVMSYFVTVKDSGIVAAMHGGMGRNSMKAEFLRKYGIPLTIRKDFLRGLDKVENERVDLVLGNHPEQNDTLGKMKRVLAGEPSILDSDEWKTMICANKRGFARFLENDS